MGDRSHHRRIYRNIPLWLFAAIAVTGASASAQQPTRDLSNFAGPGTTFTVFVTLDVPGGTIVAAAQDAPPGGWAVSNISHGGGWDALTSEVKWGLFFDPSIPPVVTYDVTPPAAISSASCFSGNVSYGGPEVTFGGDLCIPAGVPAASEWGLFTLGLLMLSAGTLAMRHRKNEGPQPR